MVSISFKVDDRFLASYLIANYRPDRYVGYVSPKTRKGIVAFQDLAWELSTELSTLIDGRYPLCMYPQNVEKSYKEIGSELEKYIQKLVNTEEYKKLKRETQESVKKIENEWENNYKKTSSYIKSIGIDIKGDYTVWLVHPGLKAGRYTGSNKIVWSYQTYWKNYNTVYLWHEILHSYFGRSDSEHALIELITDEEMRTKLNGGKYPPFVGHKDLASLKEKFLPAWKHYLGEKLKNTDMLVKKLVDLESNT